MDTSILNRQPNANRYTIGRNKQAFLRSEYFQFNSSTFRAEVFFPDAWCKKSIHQIHQYKDLSILNSRLNMDKHAACKGNHNEGGLCSYDSLTEHPLEIPCGNQLLLKDDVNVFGLPLTSACCLFRTQQDVQMLTHLSSCPHLPSVESGDEASELGFTFTLKR